MELQQILDAIGTNPTLVEGLLQPIFESEKGKTALTNRINAEVTTRIADEISKTHSRYDDDAFAVLGERPGEKDGKKEKTHEFLKSKLEELKELRSKKDSLTKEEEVRRLTAEIETLKKEGGGSHIQRHFDEAKQQWLQKEADYQKQIEDAGKSTTELRIKGELSTALTSLDFNPDVTESIRNIVLGDVERRLMSGAKIEGEKVVFYTPEGKPLLNPTTAEPMTAAEALKSMAGVQEIIKKSGQGGGGANPTLPGGGVKTVKVEGTDKKKLDVPVGSFTTQLGFQEVTDKLLQTAGLTKRDDDWDRLKNDAYKEYNVSSLPIQ